jgi:uncharacterized membrane protein
MIKNKKLLIITSVIILLPILAGLLLWDKLPEQMPMHWNAAGDVDGWMAKPAAVYAPPFFMLVLHLLCVLVTATDPKNKTQGIKVLQLTMWICPVMSVFLNAMVYAASMGIAVDASLFGPLLVGMVLVIVGNYLPKCRQNYTIGIKLPWTLNSEENWNATHRFAGRMRVAAV